MPARLMCFLDEVDAYAGLRDEKATPVTLAERAEPQPCASRVLNVLFMVSNPDHPGARRIEREFEASDQRRYFRALSRIAAICNGCSRAGHCAGTKGKARNGPCIHVWACEKPNRRAS